MPAITSRPGISGDETLHCGEVERRSVMFDRPQLGDLLVGEILLRWRGAERGGSRSAIDAMLRWHRRAQDSPPKRASLRGPQLLASGSRRPGVCPLAGPSTAVRLAGSRFAGGGVGPREQPQEGTSAGRAEAASQRARPPAGHRYAEITPGRAGIPAGPRTAAGHAPTHGRPGEDDRRVQGT
jgi:hypothetical protein